MSSMKIPGDHYISRYSFLLALAYYQELFYNIVMKKKKAQYLHVAATQDMKDEVARIAKRDRRSMAEQGRVIFEIGLREYKRFREIEIEAERLDRGE